jgi:hypothetical protein
VHSPQACLPGGGWQIETFGRREVPNVLPDGSGIVVNRVEIALGEERQLVYYWFAQRGRVLTNEFLVKWYIFWDGLTKSRTDGALVRLITYVGDKTALPEADARLEAFLRAADPKRPFTCLAPTRCCTWPLLKKWPRSRRGLTPMTASTSDRNVPSDPASHRGRSPQLHEGGAALARPCG